MKTTHSTAPSQNPRPVLPYTEEPDPEQRRRAVRAVASAALDAEDCAELLDALGLAPEEGRSVPTQRTR
ncbi:hypothetical protein SAXI111661_11885 [Saccharomonospora xinjiangensis]|uniref:Uncharacterized protein n=1 Tax=Saccharomonospora xinjiangensis XJ-54 TaxID=882086 RepID=I0V1P3_9PSEU|nr:hypothetical protein [Saccharomonospora xinjiangensis]EID54046.1 hypothetical protein SacxiDRAFT_1804 [Saccharomonospora xinjiangensis XJ-54]QBQ58653.1 hypothetical protein EYD13_01330 [Saccharomonospora xinjiangensis]